jgi:pSer/pThr/pTyr-binding forkhead associated (FHA) protein
MLRDAGGKLTIGRKQELVHLHIDDRSLSRQHAAITQRGQGIYLEDRESANGTWVNDDKLGAEYEAIKLKPGDRVRLGSLDLTFRTET